ncbi:hypothetical protein, variant 1 [Aphanomyces astaci]|uniref:Man1/Src1-like C-terminal domain-containing protein n=1 Tax=Aphanomyces astaci TaxID=112090 RepID=W4GE16_APHAT|nr:hypothetical protein, variant 1 [Aphanomyces astaci]ETV77932.1 hypothetical protein, variant 1 [Aphanomyces astaci]|eukprot:XP_009832271.1 hypothetical protein, variant 1 [Aphanomyces astaci]
MRKQPPSTPAAVDKARRDALEAQKKRTDDSIARRTATSHSSSAATSRPKLAAASAKRKQIQTAAFQSPLKRHKPSSSTSKFVPTAKCVRCHVRDEFPRTKCLLCSASVHLACTTPVARRLGIDAFPNNGVYCSIECYTEDTGNAVPTTTFTTTAMEPTTTTKHAARPAETPVAALPPTPTVHGRASSASGAFVEGDAITSAILKHSGVKAPRPLELPPRSFSRQHPPPRPPSPERKTLQFQSISPIKTSPVQQPSSSTQKKGASIELADHPDERVRYVHNSSNHHDTSPSIEDDARYHDYFNPPRFLPRTTSPSTSGASCSSLSSVSKWSAAAILVGLVSMAAVLLAGLYMDSIPFCDSNDTTNTPGWCQPCPDNGICFSGDLQSCKQPYLKVERACLEPSTVTRDADLMTHLLPRFLVKRASNVLCNQSLLATWQHQGTAEKTSTTSQVVTSAFELRNYLLHQAMWDNVDAAVFDVTFTKAMRQLKQGHPEYYYTSDGDVVLGRDDVDLWCALQLHVQDYVQIYATLLAIGLITWAIVTWHRRRRASKSQIKRLVHAVHVALKQPSNDLVDGAVSHLRHSLWGGKNDRTWQRVVQAIHQDARIRERYIVHRGQQVLIWEWIGTRRDDRNILRGQPVELVE